MDKVEGDRKSGQEKRSVQRDDAGGIEEEIRKRIEKRAEMAKQEIRDFGGYSEEWDIDGKLTWIYPGGIEMWEGSGYDHRLFWYRVAGTFAPKYVSERTLRESGKPTGRYGVVVHPLDVTPSEIKKEVKDREEKKKEWKALRAGKQ